MIESNTPAALEFLKLWHKGRQHIVLTAIQPDTRKIETISFSPEQEAEISQWIERRQGTENIYFTVNETRGPSTRKPSKEDMKAAHALHVDIDPAPGKDIQEERVKALKALREFEPAPSVIVDSGGGYQGFWMLSVPVEFNGDITKIKSFEAFNIQLERELHGDSCHNADRIMRVPGTINVPDARKREKGRVEALAKCLQFDENFHNLDDFIAAPIVDDGSSPLSTGKAIEIPGNLPPVDLENDLPDGVEDRIKMLIVQGEDPDDQTRYASRSEVLFAVICGLVRHGTPDSTIAAILLDPDFKISASVLEKPNPRIYVARQIQRGHEEAIDPALREMNEKHAVITMDDGGKVTVIEERYDPVLNRVTLARQSFAQIKDRYCNKFVDVPKGNKVVQSQLGQWWLNHPQRREYDGIYFHPGHEAVGNYFNLWQGYAVQPLRGDCKKFLEHIHRVICSGNDEHFAYLMGWLARLVQYPDRPGTVAVVLRGKQGTGKSFFAKEVGQLFGRHFLQVSDPKHLVGSFNAHLRDCVLLFGDEAFYAGDKKHESTLKTLITEEMLTIEAKGVDAVASPNFIHLIMASNSDWVVPAGDFERRYFVLDVSDDMMQDRIYFRELANEMRSGGREALLHYLLNYDLGGFDVRNFPRTEALQEQRNFSLPLEQSWMLGLLQDGRLLSDHSDWQPEVPKDWLFDNYLEFAKNTGSREKRLTKHGLTTKIKAMFAEVRLDDYQKWIEFEKRDPRTGQVKNTRQRLFCWHFPTLDECRTAFEDQLNSPVSWDTSKTINEQGVLPTGDIPF